MAELLATTWPPSAEVRGVIYAEPSARDMQNVAAEPGR